MLGRNTEKNKRLLVSTDKENNEETDITTKYKITFITSIRFMPASLWNLAGNLAEKIHEKSAMSIEKKIVEILTTESVTKKDVTTIMKIKNECVKIVGIITVIIMVKYVNSITGIASVF